MSRRTSTNQKKRHGIIAAVVIFLCFIGVGVFLNIYFHTTKIVILGNESYTESEIKKAVTSNGYIGNTLFMSVKNKVRGQTYYPFISSVRMSFHEPHTLEVNVTEKTRAGVVKKDNEYYYFNLAGKVLEKKTVLLENVAALEDSEMGTAVVGEYLPTTEARLNEIVQTVRCIANNELSISKISLDQSGNLTLTHGKIEILIGSSDYIDAKIAKLHQLLDVVEEEYEEGTINMELYTDNNEIITFQK